MTYLLDVNALVAFGFENHDLHTRVTSWIGSLKSPQLATCAITELGFVRVLALASAYGLAIAQSRALLLQLKQTSGLHFTFIADSHDASQLPAWVKTANQTTDGHLARLAGANGAVLATLDRKIPGAFLIPE